MSTLTVVYGKSIFDTNQRLGQFPNVQDYSHIIDVSFGYKSCNFSVSVQQNDIEDWLENGLGRDIVVYSNSGAVVWQGIVDDISANIGGLNIAVGSLSSVYNNIAVQYSPIITDVDPPLILPQTLSDYASDATSQAKYGIRELILSSGEVPVSEALELRNNYLAHNKDPETTQVLSVGNTSGISLNIACVGYAEFLSLFTYNNSGTASTTASAKIQAIVASDPNSVFSTDYSGIETNSLSVTGHSDTNIDGYSAISEIVELGDANDNRYIFQVLADRKVYYKPIPTTAKYRQTLFDPSGRIFSDIGLTINPWDVKAGEWVLITDLFSTSGRTANLQSNLSALFIESVEYIAPYQLILNGGKTSTIYQKIAKLGIGGI